MFRKFVLFASVNEYNYFKSCYSRPHVLDAKVVTIYKKCNFRILDATFSKKKKNDHILN